MGGLGLGAPFLPNNLSEKVLFFFFQGLELFVFNVLERSDVTSEAGGHPLWFDNYFQSGLKVLP